MSIEKKPGPPCTVCTSPHRADFEAAVLAGDSIRSVASRHGMSRDAAYRHIRHSTPRDRKTIKREASRRRDLLREGVIVAEVAGAHAEKVLDRCASRAEMLLTAAHDWLLDPNDPAKYNLNPRTHEVEIVYERREGERTVRETRKLHDLMEAVETGLGVKVIRGETKIADPRRLLLEAVATLKPVVELRTRMLGGLPPEKVGGELTLSTAAALYAALAPWPEARAAAVNALRAAMPGNVPMLSGSPVRAGIEEMPSPLVDAGATLAIRQESGALDVSTSAPLSGHPRGFPEPSA